MREFPDENGQVWLATIQTEVGVDYKGRHFLYLVPQGEEEAGGHGLADIRWNSRQTAARTLSTMSDVELRRRLRSARVRGSESPVGGGV